MRPSGFAADVAHFRTARGLGAGANADELGSWNPRGDPAPSHFPECNASFWRTLISPPEIPISTMNSEFYDALVSAGADETKAREAAMSVARHDTDITEIKASLLLLKWMVGFTLAFVVALTWRVFQ